MTTTTRLDLTEMLDELEKFHATDDAAGTPAERREVIRKVMLVTREFGWTADQVQAALGARRKARAKPTNGTDLDLTTVKKGDRFRVFTGRPADFVHAPGCEERCCASVVSQTVEVQRVGRKRRTLAVTNGSSGCTLLLDSGFHRFERVAADTPLSCLR